MARAVAGNKLVERGFKAPDSVWAVIVSVVERAAPDEVIVEGPNAQAAPEWKPGKPKCHGSIEDVFRRHNLR